MYLPKHHEQTDLTVLHGLIKAYPLAAWVSQVDGELAANHIPFLLDPSRGEYGTLTAHVARANPVWQSLPATGEALVIFQGPEAYISPSWYPSKQAHGKAVPTWNYAVAHARGQPRVIEDRDWLLRHLTELSDTHEAEQAVPWKLADAPPEFIERMLGAIVGIEIPIARLTGKWKVSQNRPLADRIGVAEGLSRRGDPRADDMARLVKSH